MCNMHVKMCGKISDVCHIKKGYQDNTTAALLLYDILYPVHGANLIFNDIKCN